MIDKSAHGRAVKNAAARDHGWNPDDVEVGAVNRLDRNGCAFFRAKNTAALDRPPAEYAVLPGGDVVGGREQLPGAATVLRRCGDGAPAEWWAQVITRFSGKVRGIVVDPQNAPSALRKIRQAGGEWAPPNLVARAGTMKVTFYTIAYEEGVPYEVQATLSKSGGLTVDTKKIAAQSRGD